MIKYGITTNYITRIAYKSGVSHNVKIYKLQANAQIDDQNNEICDGFEITRYDTVKYTFKSRK